MCSNFIADAYVQWSYYNYVLLLHFYNSKQRPKDRAPAAVVVRIVLIIQLLCLQGARQWSIAICNSEPFWLPRQTEAAIRRLSSGLGTRLQEQNSCESEEQTGKKYAFEFGYVWTSWRAWYTGTTPALLMATDSPLIDDTAVRDLYMVVRRSYQLRVFTCKLYCDAQYLRACTICLHVFCACVMHLVFDRLQVISESAKREQL